MYDAETILLLADNLWFTSLLTYNNYRTSFHKPYPNSNE